MSRALKERLAWLEQHKSRRSLPRVVLAIFGKDDGEVTGYRAGGLVATRAAGEALCKLQARAWALGNTMILETLYRDE